RQAAPDRPPAVLADRVARSSQRSQPFRVLADEARDAAPVPECPPGEEPAIGLGRVDVADYRLRHVPALPARLLGPVAEIDVLPIHAEARVEAAQLVEHLPAEQQEGSEHPVRFGRLGRPVLEQVMLALPGLGVEYIAQRSPPDE